MSAPEAPDLCPAVHPERDPPMDDHRATLVHMPDPEVVNPTIQGSDDMLQGFYVLIIHVAWPTQGAVWEPRLLFRIRTKIYPSI